VYLKNIKQELRLAMVFSANHKKTSLLLLNTQELAKVKTLSKILFGFYLLFLLWLVLFKFTLHFAKVFSSHIRGINLIPFAGLAQGSSLVQLGLNLVFFVPFGLFLSVNLKQPSFRRKLAYIFLFSVAVELIQFIFAIGITDITDVIANTAGGLLGLALYEVGHRYIDSKKLDTWIAATVGTFLILLSATVFSLQLFHGRHRAALMNQTFPSQRP
jgi:glycopeptide antibiotics resistance protein